MPTVIRAMRDTDQEQLIALWRAAGVARPWNDPEQDIAFARRGPHSTILVAADEDRILASAMVGEDGHRGWVHYVAVLPEYQNSGLGRAIMQAAEEWLAAHGVWKVQLLVRAGNERVLGFYARLGYHDTRTTCLQKILPPAAKV